MRLMADLDVQWVNRGADWLDRGALAPSLLSRNKQLRNLLPWSAAAPRTSAASMASRAESTTTTAYFYAIFVLRGTYGDVLRIGGADRHHA